MPGRRAVSSYSLALQVLVCIAIGGCVFQPKTTASLKSGHGIVRTRVGLLKLNVAYRLLLSQCKALPSALYEHYQVPSPVYAGALN